MTRLEYELIRYQIPDAKLPDWHMISEESRQSIANVTRDQLISSIVDQYLSGDYFIQLFAPREFPTK